MGSKLKLGFRKHALPNLKLTEKAPLDSEPNVCQIMSSMLQGISGFGCQLRQSRVRLPSQGWPDYPKKPRLCRKSAEASHFTDLSILTLHEQYRCTAPVAWNTWAERCTIYVQLDEDGSSNACPSEAQSLVRCRELKGTHNPRLAPPKCQSRKLLFFTLRFSSLSLRRVACPKK